MPKSAIRQTRSQSSRLNSRTCCRLRHAKGASTTAPRPTRSAEPIKTGIAPVTILLTGVAEPKTAMPSARRVRVNWFWFSFSAIGRSEEDVFGFI